MKNRIFRIMVFSFLCVIPLLTGSSEGSVIASEGFDPAASPGNMQRAIMPSLKQVQEAPTEGGFVFYNRQFITATYAKKRQILLTFDDGPNPHTTPIVLDVLKRRGLKGIFFVVGVNVRKYPEILKRIQAEGHTIGNHSYFHINLSHYGQDRVLKEIRDTNALIQQVVGVKPTLFRPPYGALNHNTLEILRREGMDVMLWSIDPGDWRNRNMSKTVANLSRQLKLSQGGQGGIVLLHDTLPSTAHALEPFLVALTQQELLPRPFDTGNFSTCDRNFWASTSPKPMLWNEGDGLTFDPKLFHNTLLFAILTHTARHEISPLLLLKARKSGNFLKVLLCSNM